MMVEITFHSHATTDDNEANRASGHNQAQLSAKGIAEAKRLGENYPIGSFDVIYCSDLDRAYDTARLAFGEQYPIIKDARLKEVDYGTFTLKPKAIVAAERERRINKPFPGGESYDQVIKRMQLFLNDLARTYDGQKVLIIGHGGTRFALEHLINKVPLSDCFSAFQKSPGATEYLISKPIF